MSETGSDLAERRCRACDATTPALHPAAIERYMQQIPQWQMFDRHIERTFRFKDFHRTMAFVNAVAWIAHREDHHPELHVGYNQCRVCYTTHAIGGLSENDLICAAKVDALLP